MVRLARSTATRCRALNPRRETNSRVRSWTRRSALKLSGDGMRCASVRGVYQMAGDAVSRPDLHERRHDGLADLHRVRAARMKAAASRGVVERRRAARNADPLSALVQFGQGVDQVLRVWMQRLLEQRERVGLF